VPKESNADRDQLGKAVKAARKARGLTQSQLAGLLGITTRYVKLIENSGRKPSYDLLDLLISELSLSPDSICRSEEEQSQTKIYLLPGGKKPR
jgi:transcriptional regulator with XRE-family HTH domain